MPPNVRLPNCLAGKSARGFETGSLFNKASVLHPLATAESAEPARGGFALVGQWYTAYSIAEGSSTTVQRHATSSAAEPLP